MNLIELIGLAVAAIAALWFGASRIRRRAHKEGREEAEELARRLDHENAADIRNRARSAGGVRSDDDTRGYRD